MKKLLFILMLSLSFSATSQEKVKLAAYQDFKLAVLGSDGYKAFTPDMLFKLKMTGNQQEFGYMVVSPLFEYAELEGIYKRYAVDVGYTFNRLVVKDLEATFTVNYGIQDRWSKAFLVFGADAELAYKITNNVSISLLLQSVQRKDLQWAYGDRVIRLSGFVGLIFEL